MFNININWLKIIKENLPFFLQTNRRLDWILALISPFNQIYQEFLVQYQVYVYKIRFNGQVQYLEKILNDKFSPVSGGIYIEDGSTISSNYIYRKSELRPPIYLHRKWKASPGYLINNYCISDNIIWRANINNPANQPYRHHHTGWDFVREAVYLRRRSEYNIQFNFIVKVPISLTFDQISMKAIIDFYRLAGKRYKIETY